MTIQVEFFGIVRHRAGLAAIDVEAETLGDVFSAVTDQLPALKDICGGNGRLQTGYLANINGQKFVSDVETPLHPGDSILILSADVGG